MDGESTHTVEKPFYGFAGTLKIADADFLILNVRKMSWIGTTSPISFSEAKNTTSGTRRLKTTIRSTSNAYSL